MQLSRVLSSTLESLFVSPVATLKSDDDALLEKVASSVDILLLSSNRWLEKNQKSNSCRIFAFVQTLSAGVDSLNFKVIPNEVLVCRNVGGYSEQVAEHVFGKMLCLARNLVARYEELRKGIFNETSNGIFLR
jgi:phosphoglycerate dehydrogenase-like enzyme